jgi:hypothetical protein
MSRSQTTSSSKFVLVGLQSMLNVVSAVLTECLSDLLQPILTNIAS